MNEVLAIYHYVGQKIRYHRRLHNLTQEELAQQIGCSRTSLVHWEEGKNRVQLEDLYRICLLFHCGIEAFLPQPNERLLKTREQAFLEFLETEAEDESAQQDD